MKMSRRINNEKYITFYRRVTNSEIRYSLKKAHTHPHTL